MLQTFRYSFMTSPKRFLPQSIQVRSFWEYVNMMFNNPDKDRIKQFGPDRTCAEWVLRNGGKIVWEDGTKITDYNVLPPEGFPVKKVREIDGTDSSISHYGFSHLIGCNMLQKIILHNNKYVDDRAMTGLHHAESSLRHVQVSRCVNITDAGLKELKILPNLETVVLFDLESVSDLKSCILFLQQHLPNCKIAEKDF